MMRIIELTPNHITNHEKGKHLTYEDYVIIELRLKDGWKPNAIAKKELHCAPNTVRNIIKKGMTPLYNGKVLRFKAKTAWNAYQENRRHSCRTYEALEKRPFLQYVEKHFQEDQWSLDACVGRALEEGGFDRSDILCTKTLYNYVDLGLLNIKSPALITIWCLRLMDMTPASQAGNMGSTPVGITKVFKWNCSSRVECGPGKPRDAGSSPASSTIHEKSELIPSRERVRISYFHQTLNEQI